MNESHVELPGSRRPMKSGARRLRDVDPSTHVEVTVTLKAPPLPDADKMAEQTAITPSEFAERYGASPADVHKVESVLHSFGLTVEESSLGGRSLRVSGTAASIESAFQPNLAIYASADQGEFRGRTGVIKVPSEIAGLVTGVFGLDQRRVAQRASAEAKPVEAIGGSGVAPLSSSDLETRYNFPAGDGAGRTVAIAEFGAPLQSGSFLPPAYFPDDVTAFCTAQGRSAPSVQIVPVNLAPLTLAQLKQLPKQLLEASFGETTEVMMDVEIIAALAPKADVLVYFATFDQKGWVDLLDQVIAGHPARAVSLSISYGLAEDSPDWSTGALQAINEHLQAAAMIGITVCVSAGDDGSGADMTGSRAHVEFPASSPFVLSVGGTMLKGGNEIVWWEAPGRRTFTKKGGGATGGGVSNMFKRAAWQTVSVPSINPTSIDGRVVPDVAALAGPPLYELTLLGESSPNGGTSASAPLWAALIARISAKLPPAKQQRFLAPLLYQNGPSGKPRGQTGCRDISVGNNASKPNPGKGYVAAKGFDAVTGWGVPDGQALLKTLQ